MNLIYTPLKSHTITSNPVKIIKVQNDQEKEIKPIMKINSSAESLSGFIALAKVNDKMPVENNEDIRNVSESWRKAKQIIEQADEKNEDFLGQETIKKYDSVLEEDVGGEITTIPKRVNRYEVEEDIDNNQDIEKDNIEEGFGYDYSPPVAQNLNFSSTLIKILSKYNIKADDHLQNYDLSRQRKVKVPFVPEISHFRYRYNSLNHLTVDPLLAVFLSNYGFYIPSLYGIKSNYNNLYGYLASNNIHNNRPFGLYKIFSDTDSWN